MSAEGRFVDTGTFGMSGKIAEVYEHFGITTLAAVEAATRGRPRLSIPPWPRVAAGVLWTAQPHAGTTSAGRVSAWGGMVAALELLEADSAEHAVFLSLHEALRTAAAWASVLQGRRNTRKQEWRTCFAS